MSTITFVPTQRGGTALIFDGYRYNKVRCNNDKNVTYWRCSKNRNCPGRAVTVDNRVKKTNNKHNHPPEAPLTHHAHHNPFLNMAAAAAAAAAHQHAAAQLRAHSQHQQHPLALVGPMSGAGGHQFGSGASMSNQQAFQQQQMQTSLMSQQQQQQVQLQIQSHHQQQLLVAAAAAAANNQQLKPFPALSSDFQNSIMSARHAAVAAAAAAIANHHHHQYNQPHQNHNQHPNQNQNQNQNQVQQQSQQTELKRESPAGNSGQTVSESPFGGTAERDNGAALTANSPSPASSSGATSTTEQRAEGNGVGGGQTIPMSSALAGFAQNSSLPFSESVQAQIALLSLLGLTNPLQWNPSLNIEH